jgi:hypothetical protein
VGFAREPACFTLRSPCQLTSDGAIVLILILISECCNLNGTRNVAATVNDRVKTQCTRPTSNYGRAFVNQLGWLGKV